jgi:hypothetical protein
MASEVTIANAALRRLGSLTITSFTEQSVPARIAKDTYADLRDSLLRMHPWKFAMKRASIPALAAAPDWGWAREFPFPASPDYCLRVWWVQNQSIETGNWTVEGRSVLTNFDSPLPILFVRRIEDENMMDPLFRDALSAYLASEWAQPLTKQESIEESMARKFQLKLAEARAANGQEGTPQVMEANEWDHARWAGSSLDGANGDDSGPYNY